VVKGGGSEELLWPATAKFIFKDIKLVTCRILFDRVPSNYMDLRTVNCLKDHD